MATTGPRAVKAALKTLLNANGDLTDVTIFTYTAKGEELVREYIVLGDVEGSIEALTMGGNTLSEYTIECESMIHQPAADDAQDRAWTMLDAVASVLASGWTVSGNVIDAELDTWSLEETVKDDGNRRVDVEFTIKVRDTSG